ncbi:MAG: hypothetical protein VB032_04615 [Burkholderiaceae bacterium]|nr:hypothetical protein [Burkholderiaceae bacterium]
MTQQTFSFRGEYTCKVGGEHYQYELEYSGRKVIHWRARIYQDGDLKGNPSGNIFDNTLDGEDLHQYIVANIEGILEKGLGIAE